MGKVKSDIEIAREAKMKPIQEVLNGLNVPDKSEVYSPIGRYIAKIKTEYLDTLKDKKDGKLILVTAITPTPAGEGKTTTSVGLNDGLNKIGKKSIVCLREPSLGPSFGMKGGAAGRRLCTGSSYGTNKFTFYWGLSCNNICSQSSFCFNR